MCVSGLSGSILSSRTAIKLRSGSSMSVSAFGGTAGGSLNLKFTPGIHAADGVSRQSRQNARRSDPNSNALNSSEKVATGIQLLPIDAAHLRSSLPATDKPAALQYDWESKVPAT